MASMQFASWQTRRPAHPCFADKHLSLKYSWRSWRNHTPGRPTTRGTGRLCAAKGDGEGPDFNIDELAKRLSAEAEKMRLSGASIDPEDEEDEGKAAGSQESKDSLLQPLGYQAISREEDMLREVGDGGFFASEFELEEILGQISIQQVERNNDPEAMLPSAARKSRAAVIAYVASYYSGLPFQDPVFVMLKEYLPAAKAVACNELQVLNYLTGMPETGRKWSRAKAALTPDPPIAQLLGYFTAGLSEQAEQILAPSSSAGPADPAPAPAEPRAVAPPEAGAGAGESTMWVVMKWEGLTPVALYPSSPQQPRSGFGMLWGANDSPFRDRIRMLRSICCGSLAALAYCHQRGVVHGSLGSGSILLSTFNDQDAAQLVVKLDNFGFAQRILPPAPGGSTGSSRKGIAPDPGAAAAQLVPQPRLDEDTPLALGQKQDLRALAIVLLECLLSALAEGGPSPQTSANAIERLLGEVFQWDLEAFRQYCSDEPSWSTAVAFLDDEGQAGWALIEALIQGTAPAAQLRDSYFCQL